jgi:DNA-binding NtrC family response regulator
MLVMRPKVFTTGIVVATPQGDDVRTLHALLAGSAWKIISVSTSTEAVWTIRHLRVPIVLCDLRHENRPWQETLRTLRRARSGTCVIFMSNEFDRGLADEISRRGGFDLLIRPFAREQVLQSLFFAYGQYKLSSTIYSLGRMENSRIAKL